MTRNWRAATRGTVIAAVFSLGYLFGTMQSPAEAQLGEMGKELGSDALSKASGSEGMLGQAAELGKSIAEMQEHVSGLQKNLDTLNTIKSALGG